MTPALGAVGSSKDPDPTRSRQIPSLWIVQSHRLYQTNTLQLVTTKYLLLICIMQQVYGGQVCWIIKVYRTNGSFDMR